MNSKNRIWISLLAGLLLFACTPALYLPTSSDALKVGMTTDSLLLGRTLYVNHCGSCHNLHLPEKYTGHHWIEKMPEMQQKAKISDKDTRLITTFLIARSKPL